MSQHPKYSATYLRIPSLFGRSLLLVFLAVQGGVVSNPGTAMGIASAKTSLTFVQAFARGILCNWLVCMAGACGGRILGGAGCLLA